MDEKMPMQKLLNVQRVDLRIMDLEHQTTVIPRQIQEWDNSLNSHREELRRLKDGAETIKKEQRRLEHDLDAKQTELAKYNAQLPQIKTNREYKAILVEIDAVEKRISDLEEEVLMKMAEVEEVETGIKAKEAEAQKAQEETEREKEKLKQKRTELEQSLEGTRSERKDLAADVDTTLMVRYDKIRVRKGGLAITQIDDESCGACHMALPPQLVNEVMGGKIKSCPNCMRLLYWNEA